MTDEYIAILQKASKIAKTHLRDPDTANGYTAPKFDNGTIEGKRIPIGRAQLDERILKFQKGSPDRETGIYDLGHFIEEKLKNSNGR